MKFDKEIAGRSTITGGVLGALLNDRFKWGLDPTLATMLGVVILNVYDLLMYRLKKYGWLAKEEESE